MTAIVADTHTAVWYLAEPTRLSSMALTTLRTATRQDESIYLSAISLIELRFLIERSRLRADIFQEVIASLAGGSPSLELVPIDLEIAHSVGRIQRQEVPELADRIITATALHLGVPLVTRDGKIRASSVTTIW